MATIKTIIYRSKTLANGNHPVYIRLTEKGCSYLPIYKRDTRFQAKPEQWDELNNRFVQNKRIKEDHKDLNEIIGKRELKLKNIVEGFINGNEPWTVKMVKELFYNDFDQTNVFDFIDNKVEKLNEMGKEREVNNYLVIKKELADISKGKLSFSDIDYDFTSKLIRRMSERNLKDTTIGIRLRYLRKILNEAITEKVGSKLTYPFSNVYGTSKTIKISKFEKMERKIAIDLNSIEKIKKASFLNIKTETARRLFLASYAARGMNFRDMLHLNDLNKYHAQGVAYLHYKRNKTGASLNFPISPLLQEQIDWFQLNTTLQKGKIFPINSKGIKKQLDLYNYQLKKIAKELYISSETMGLSSYAARHSFATNLYHNGVDVNVISETLAHTNTNTTKAYLKKFSTDVVDNQISAIIG